MTRVFSFTQEQLTELLDEFSEFWEAEWMNENKKLPDDNCDASEYFLRRKLLDPVWPDTPPELRVK